MKKLNLLWLMGIMMLLPICFTSCSDDDDEVPGSSSSLIGKWEIIYNKYQYKEDGKIIEQGEGEASGIGLIFHENGTCEHGEYYSGRWHWENMGTWIYKNGKISVTDGGYTETVTVKKLTDSSLIVELFDKYTEDGVACEDYEYSEYRKISD